MHALRIRSYYISLIVSISLFNHTILLDLLWNFYCHVHYMIMKIASLNKLRPIMKFSLFVFIIMTGHNVQCVPVSVRRRKSESPHIIRIWEWRHTFSRPMAVHLKSKRIKQPMIVPLSDGKLSEKPRARLASCLSASWGVLVNGRQLADTRIATVLKEQRQQWRRMRACLRWLPS